VTVGGALGPFLAGWTAMMAAMMLPSALPMIRMFRLVAAEGPRPRARVTVFVPGYLLVWAAVGIVVWALSPVVDEIVMADLQGQLVAGTLLVAGAYQLTPLKRVCLRACRSPMDFLLTHWYAGVGGALRLGAAHGWYCLGCCWALMALFVFVGAMDLVWAGAIALVVFVEKVLPRGEVLGRGAGVALVAAAAAVFARPDLAHLIGTGM
jgi:predicted metal-binding membrane protein